MLDGPRTISCVTWVFAAACGIAMLLRSFIKMRVIRHIGADDFFIWGAFIFFIGQCVSCQFQVQNGLGSDEPLDSFPQETILREMRAQYAKHLLYMPVTAFAKLAVVSMLRKFSINRRDRILLYSFEWFLVGFAVISEFVWAFSCKSPDPWNHYHKCISRDGWIITFEMINALTEIALIAMPTLSIARMDIPLKKKLFAASFFAVRLTILPFIALIIVYNAIEQDHGFTLQDVHYTLFTMITAALQVLYACAVYARPLFKILETGSFSLARRRSAQRASKPPGALLFDAEGSWPFTRMPSPDRLSTSYSAHVRGNHYSEEKITYPEPAEDIHIHRQVDVLSSNGQPTHVAQSYDRPPMSNERYHDRTHEPIRRVPPAQWPLHDAQATRFQLRELP